ncbi:PIG-L family deacetylase [Propionibacterium sp.]|uniref:PIG-L family deacetylase n=1 Tax=Propionibacterium sp. TaxID=1977903 RepID=UPI0039E8C229
MTRVTDNSMIHRILESPEGLRVLVMHAHPDDDTLSTGPLIAWLSRRGAQVDLLTFCRGERGEIVPGVLPAGVGPEELVTAREAERAAACDCLGVRNRWFMGMTPWRAAGLAERRYKDSGMRWVTPTVAGPAGDAGPESVTGAPVEEQVDDVLAGLSVARPDVLISYDNGGSYGHPDHIRVHEVAGLAARRAGLALVQFASHDDVPGASTDEALWLEPDDPAITEAVLAALRCYRTQLTVVGEGEDTHIQHVGGQRQEIPRRVGLLSSPV